MFINDPMRSPMSSPTSSLRSGSFSSWIDRGSIGTEIAPRAWIYNLTSARSRAGRHFVNFIALLILATCVESMLTTGSP